MWKLKALFPGHSLTWCLLLHSFVSCEEDERRETVENEPHEHRPRTLVTGENSGHVDALIQENGQITVRKVSGILNISDGSVKTIIKQHL
jgi:hypothetical protein